MIPEEGVALSRFTTLGTGGPARAFARPETLEEVEQALAWASDRELPVATVGLGSNLLIADTGFEGLVLKLGGELAEATVEGERLVAGGGAANAVCLHRVRAAGLGGFEFACAIPGTIGGGVWMNAGAYGSDWAAILERALVVDADGARWLTPEELGLSYRHSELRLGQVVARGEFLLAPLPEEQIKANVARLQALRKAAQPTNKRTFGSVFKNPEHELSAGRILEACGLKGHRRELHRERRRGAFGRCRCAHGGSAQARARPVRRRAQARGRVPGPARAASARVGGAFAAAKAVSCQSASPSVRAPARR